MKREAMNEAQFDSWSDHLPAEDGGYLHNTVEDAVRAACVDLASSRSRAYLHIWSAFDGDHGGLILRPGTESGAVGYVVTKRRHRGATDLTVYMEPTAGAIEQAIATLLWSMDIKAADVLTIIAHARHDSFDALRSGLALHDANVLRRTVLDRTVEFLREPKS